MLRGENVLLLHFKSLKDAIFDGYTDNQYLGYENIFFNDSWRVNDLQIKCRGGL